MYIKTIVLEIESYLITLYLLTCIKLLEGKKTLYPLTIITSKDKVNFTCHISCNLSFTKDSTIQFFHDLSQLNCKHTKEKIEKIIENRGAKLLVVFQVKDPNSSYVAIIESDKMIMIFFENNLYEYL